MTKTLYWIPRILAILFILFISIFALDAFAEGIPFWEAILGFLIHLVPTYILVVFLVVAWKRGILGGILFIAIGIFYILWARNMHWSAYVFVAGPSILIGGLFNTGKKKSANIDETE